MASLPEKDVTFLVDASSFIFRAYYALAPLSSKGRPSHAVSGFASILLKLLREKKPRHCVVVFDSKKPSFRKEIYTQYKANREIPPPDLSDQIVAVMDFCKRAEFPILQEEGIEADDWIASYVKSHKKETPIVIISSDKDLTQLVNSRVFMYDSFRDRVFGEKEVEEKYLVPPHQILDLLSLTGDASDNIPGVAGVGPKTAAKLLQEYGSLEKIYKNLDKMTPKMRDRFEASEDKAKLSKQLVRLKEDLKPAFKETPPLELPLPQGARDFLEEWDCTRLLDQFSEMLEGSTENAAESEIVASDFQFKLAKTKKDLDHIQKSIQKAGRTVFDCETDSFNHNEAKIVGFSLAWDQKESWYIPWRHPGGAFGESEIHLWIKKILENPKIKKIAHHAKFDYRTFLHEGIETKNVAHDTMVEAHLLYADRRSFSLDALSKDFLGREKGDLKKLLGKSQNFADVPLAEAVIYGAKDSALCFGLHELFLKELKKEKELLWLYEQVEMPLVQVIARMEEAGVLIDKKRLQSMSKEMHDTMDLTEQKIYKIAGGEFNINSPKQLQKVLFEDLGLEAIKKTKTGYSTDESVLTELALAHELPQLILDYRRVAKLTSTYVDVLPDLAAKDGRIHTSYHQTGTATGRLSSSEPNLQNIPIRTQEGRKIREAFIADKDYTFVSADYSQVELRLFAHFSNDKRMIEAFQKGRDIHSETAKIIFGSEDPEFRSRAKAINFGIIYGISAFGLSRQLGISRNEAKEFMDTYFEQFPGIESFMAGAITSAKKRKYTQTLFGRKRPIPDIDSKNPTLRNFAERIAINAPLQGTAADIMKWAMIRVDEGLCKNKMKSRLLLQVHDELIIEAAESEVDQVKSLMVEGMSNLKGTPAEKLKVPLVVDVTSAHRWSDL